MRTQVEIGPTRKTVNAPAVRSGFLTRTQLATAPMGQDNSQMRSRRVPLSGMLGVGRFALVDSEDYEIVRRYFWNATVLTGRSKTVYAKTRLDSGEQITMHRLLLRPPSGLQVDHINRNGLDNRKINLRLCTSTENKWNRPDKPIFSTRETTSQYVGVQWHRGTGKWNAYISCNGRQYSLGYYQDESVAARVYRKAKRYRDKHKTMTGFLKGKGAFGEMI